MIELYSASSNLGDNLSLTPACWAPGTGGARVHLVDDPCVRSIAPIFDGFADVVFDNPKPPRTAVEWPIPGPKSRKILWGIGRGTANPIPKIMLTRDEVAAARTQLASIMHMAGKSGAPCVIKCNTAQQSYRTPPRVVLEKIVADNPGVTFLNFGLTPKHAKSQSQHLTIEGVVEVLDLPIREQAALYQVIGRYVGPDTGDYHLMLAVGGKCDVLVPDSVWHYNHGDFLYDESCWAAETEPRVAYQNFNYPLSAGITDVQFVEFRIKTDQADAYDRLSIAQVKADKNPLNGAAQDNYDRMSVELLKMVGGWHPRVLRSPEFQAMVDINTALYERIDTLAHSTGSGQAARTESLDEEKKTKALNDERYQCKRRLQERWFGGVLAEQKFGLRDAA